MRRLELNVRRARGFLLIVAILVVVVIAVAIAALGNMTSADVRSSSGHAQSEQAYFAATSGIEYAAVQLRSGAACAALPGAATGVGSASFTLGGTLYNPGNGTAVAAGGVTAAATTIGVGTTAGYAPHGRIRIESEEIVYTGTTATSFTGAQRGAAGTTAVLHAAAVAVNQGSLCIVRSTGTAGSSVRIVESGIFPGPWSSYLAGGIASAVIVATAPGNTLGTLATNLPAGNNVVVAIVTLSSRTNAAFTFICGLANINAGDVNPLGFCLDGGTIAAASGPGNLQLRRNGATIDRKRFDVLVGGSATAQPGVNGSFPTKTHVFTYLDAGAPANPTYSVWGLANNAFASAEVKILVINNPPTIPGSTNPSSPGASGTVLLTAAQTTIQTHTTNLPAGNNVIIAAVQFYQYVGVQTPIIAAGNMRITRTAPAATLTSNQFDIDFDAGGCCPEWVASDKGFLLVAQDVGAPANATYNVTAQASAANSIYGQANMVVMQGIPNAYVDGASTPVTAAATTLATLNTSYPALRNGSDNVALVSTQYNNTNAAVRFVNPPATGENLLFGGAVQASNAFQTEMCGSGNTFCNEFSAGLLWQQNTSRSSPSFVLQSQANNTGINADAKILGLHMEPVVDLAEIVP